MDDFYHKVTNTSKQHKGGFVAVDVLAEGGAAREDFSYWRRPEAVGRAGKGAA